MIITAKQVDDYYGCTVNMLTNALTR